MTDVIIQKDGSALEVATARFMGDEITFVDSKGTVITQHHSTVARILKNKTFKDLGIQTEK